MHVIDGILRIFTLTACLIILIRRNWLFKSH